MQFWSLLADVTLLLGAAALLGIAFQRLHGSAVVGYLLAGMLVGPGLLGWISSSTEAIHEVAEIGVALLLFTIGLEISGHRLRAMAGRGLLLGLLQVCGTGVVAWAVARLFGATNTAAVVIAAMVALSSTATVARVLLDRSELDAAHGRAALGVLVLQDLALVPLLLVVGLLGEGGGGGSISAAIGDASVKLVLLVVGVIVVGVLLMPRVLRAAAIRRSADLPIVTGVVSCLAAMWLAHRLDMSPALGAFIAGLVLAGTPFAAQVRADIAPLRSIFMTLFFVSVGMLANFPWLLEGSHLLQVFLVAAGIIVGKTVLLWLLAMALRWPRRVAVATGLCLAQIGEFSFVIGSLAHDGGVIDYEAMQLLLSASLATLLVAPMLAGRARAIAARVDSALGGVAPDSGDADLSGLQNHVIVLGFGPAGQHGATAMEEGGRTVVVLDMSPGGIERARRRGLIAVLGDATRREHLVHAGIAEARLLVTTLPDHRASVSAIQQARAAAPSITVVARARWARMSRELHAAGADVVVDEEDRVGDALGDAVLHHLGQ